MLARFRSTLQSCKTLFQRANFNGSVHCEAEKQTCATSTHQIGLTAAAASVGGIPGSVASTGTIKVSHLNRTISRTAAVVLACVIRRIGKGPAIGLGTCDDVVLIGLIACPLNRFILFSQRCRARKIVAEPCGVKTVPVQISNILRDLCAPSVMPRALTDPVPGINRRGTIGSLGTEIGMPGFSTSPHCRSQGLAMGIRPFQSTQISPFADTGTGDKETQRRFCWGRGSSLLSKSGTAREKQGKQKR